MFTVNSFNIASLSQSRLRQYKVPHKLWCTTNSLHIPQSLFPLNEPPNLQWFSQRQTLYDTQIWEIVWEFSFVQKFSHSMWIVSQTTEGRVSRRTREGHTKSGWRHIDILPIHYGRRLVRELLLLSIFQLRLSVTCGSHIV